MKVYTEIQLNGNLYNMQIKFDWAGQTVQIK